VRRPSLVPLALAGLILAGPLARPVVAGRATRNMDRFAIARNGNTLVVDLGRWFQSDTQKPEWTAAVAAL
jgi:hypothetical protein